MLVLCNRSFSALKGLSINHMIYAIIDIINLFFAYNYTLIDTDKVICL